MYKNIQRLLTETTDVVKEAMAEIIYPKRMKN